MIENNYLKDTLKLNNYCHLELALMITYSKVVIFLLGQDLRDSRVFIYPVITNQS